MDCVDNPRTFVQSSDPNLAHNIYCRLGNFCREKILPVTFNNENFLSEIFSLTNKWRKFISSSDHSNENKIRRNFNTEIVYQGKISDLRYIYSVHTYRCILVFLLKNNCKKMGNMCGKWR